MLSFLLNQRKSKRKPEIEKKDGKKFSLIQARANTKNKKKMSGIGKS